MRVDPITFEVVKHRLWQINDEQANAIRTMSVSPIVVEGNDFGTGLFTKDAEIISPGAYMLIHVTTMDTIIRNVMAIASEINDGDVFLTNDPFLGACHQNDVAVVSPFFYEGEHIMWVGNVMHYADVAGMDEGSFCINADNLYQEAPRYFLKIVDRGKFSSEVERTIVTNSRLPDMVALDVRAQVGAIHVARKRLGEVLDEHGVDTVTAVAHQSIDWAEQKLRERISELPDGEWTTQVYIDGDRVGSDRIVRICLKLEKKGDHLYFDYTGTDPQVAACINTTENVTNAGTTAPLQALLCRGEIDWNSSVKRVATVFVPEGSVLNCRPPAPVSVGVIVCSSLTNAASMHVMSQMMSGSEKYRDLVCPSWANSINAVNIFGIGRRGKYVGNVLSDHRGGGAGARTFGDGFDHGGFALCPVSLMADVENQEWKLPVLYLYRKQLPDSGGPGKFRGGLTAVSAVTPHRTERLMWKSQNTSGADQSNALGIGGGYPGAGSQASVVRDADLERILGAWSIPEHYEGFGGALQHLSSKSDGFLESRDLYIYHAPGGGGVGDPFHRDLERVRQDVLRGAVTIEMARLAYGVVLTADLAVEVEGTRQERLRLVEKRKSEAVVRNGAAATLSNGAAERPVRLIVEYVEQVGDGSDGFVRCTECQHVYCSASEEPRRFAAVRHSPLRKAGPWLAERWGGNSPNFLLVEYLCPSCGVVFDVLERLQSEVQPAVAPEWELAAAPR